MSDDLLSCLVNALGQKQLVQSAKQVQEVRNASQIAQAGADRAKQEQALQHITPVKEDLLDVSGGASDADVAKWSRRGGAPDRRACLRNEVALHRAVSELAARFAALTSEHLGKKWYQHFEAWLFGRRTEALSAQSYGQPQPKRGGSGRQTTVAGLSAWERLLPAGQADMSTAADAELQRKLTAAGAPHALIDVVVAELIRLPRLLASKDRPSAGPAPHVKVSPFKGQKGAVDKLKLTCLGATLEINKEHFDKLRVLYAHNAQRAGQRYDATAFTQAAMAVLLRYSSLQGTHHRGGGFQAAAHSEVFHMLRDTFDCRLECFASPFNCRYPRYCSMFDDTDSPFGSTGSFFQFRPTSGSFQANPPFDKQFVAAMTDHMFELLAAASVLAFVGVSSDVDVERSLQDMLMFVVIIPAWEGHACWQRLERATYTSRHVLLLAGEHGFYEGAQHNRANRYRAASSATSVFFLQNAAARKRWPVTDEHEAQLRAAFAPKQSSGAPVAGVERAKASLHAAGTDALMSGDFAQAGAAKAHSADRKRARAAPQRAQARSEQQSQHAASSQSLPERQGLAQHAAGAASKSTAESSGISDSSQPQPKRKRKNKKGCAGATGKFADAGAAAAVLDRVLAGAEVMAARSQKENSSTIGPEPGSGVSADGATGAERKRVELRGSAGSGNREREVVFPMSKSQRRAHRQHRGRKQRKASGGVG